MNPITTKEAKQLIKIAAGDAWTTSLVISEQFGRPHKNVLREIDSLIEDGTLDRLSFEPISYTDEMNRGQRAYKLNERAALIAMPFIGGKKSREGQKKLVDAFLAMRQIIKQQDAYRFTFEWKQARENGKVVRLTFTDNVQEFVTYAINQGSKSADKYFMQLTKMEYAALFMIGQAVGNGFRDRLNAHQLVNLGTAELVAQRALREGMEASLHYKEIYKLAKHKVELFASMVGKSLPGERIPQLRKAA